MRIVLASDHAGFELKQLVNEHLLRNGYETADYGPSTTDPIDYPLVIAPAAREVAGGHADFGILVCGSGNGVAIAANKIHGVRAVNGHDPQEAEMARRHNDANVLTLAGRRLSGEQATAIVDAFLNAEFEGGRHQRRVEQIQELEENE